MTKSPEPVDLFLCHNSKDKAGVAHLADALRARGISVWLDEHDITPGDVWPRSIDEQIRTARAVAVLIGAKGIGGWQELEITAFIGQAASRGCTIVPVLLPDYSDEVELPALLDAYHRVDMRRPDPDPIEAIVRAVAGRVERPPRRRGRARRLLRSWAAPLAAIAVGAWAVHQVLFAADRIAPGFGLAWPSRNMAGAALHYQWLPCDGTCLPGAQTRLRLEGHLQADAFAVLNLWKPGALLPAGFTDLPPGDLAIRLSSHAGATGVEVTLKDRAEHEQRFACRVPAGGHAQDFALDRLDLARRGLDGRGIQLLAVGVSSGAGASATPFIVEIHGFVSGAKPESATPCRALLG